MVSQENKSAKKRILDAVVFTIFRIRPVIKRIFSLEFDDAYHERLKETIATLFLTGIHGVAAERQGQKGRK